MGYDLHITRRPEWSDDGSPIELADWLAVVDADPDLRLEGVAAATSPDGVTISVASTGLVVWTAHPDRDSSAGLAVFGHRRGEIVVKNPDDATIAKMLEVAALLEARVQGDDGEPYGDAAVP